MGSLAVEGRARNSQVGLHTLSPGMIITDLLLSGATVGNKVHPPRLCGPTPHTCLQATQTGHVCNQRARHVSIVACLIEAVMTNAPTENGCMSSTVAMQVNSAYSALTRHLWHPLRCI